MQTARIFSGLLLASLAGAAACASDPAPTTPVVDDGALKTACDKLFDAIVAREGRCTGVALDDASKAALRERARTSCTSSATAPGTSTTKDTIDACAGAVGQSSCDPRDTRPFCEPAPGTLADGASCFDERQCKSGFCKHDQAGSTLARCGKCAPLVAVGASCTLNDRCVKDAQCLNGGCVRVTKVALGEACVGTGNFVCDKDLVCAESGKCAARVALDGACKSSPECDLDLICLSGKCAAKKPENATCSGDEQCAPGLVCPKGKCVKVTFRAAGERCDGGATQCVTGACTASQNGVCPDVRGVGGACDPADKKTVCDRFLRCVQTGDQAACVVDDASACK
jgi:hypothetical protein